MRLNGPKVKISRALGIAITPKAALIMRKKPQPPGSAQTGRRRKVSDYKGQLLEKQRLRAQYNISERQLRIYYAQALRGTGDTGHQLVELLETRLDALVLRAGFARTIYAAKQYVGHGHFNVNGKRVTIRSYRLKVGDVVSLRAKSRNIPCFVEAREHGSTEVTYINVDRGRMSFTLMRRPQRDEVPVLCETQTVVEFYSR